MKRMMTVLTVMLAMVGLASGGVVQKAEAQGAGVAVGAKAPDLGGTLDQSGKARDLTSLMGDKGVAVLFFRSASW